MTVEEGGGRVRVGPFDDYKAMTAAVAGVMAARGLSGKFSMQHPDVPRHVHTYGEENPATGLWEWYFYLLPGSGAPAAPQPAETDFDRMTVSERRVAVAKDVLAHLDRTRFAIGSYFATSDQGVVEAACAASDAGTDLRPLVEDLRAGCRVCVMGALLLAKARLFDRVPAGVLRPTAGPDGEIDPSGSDVAAALADVFDARTLARMEATFEADASPSPFARGAAGPQELRAAAAQALKAPPGPTGRVRYVMERVVAAGGLYEPGTMSVDLFNRDYSTKLVRLRNG